MVRGDVVWSRRLADELWSGVVTPLTFSLLAPAMTEHMVRRRLAGAGLEALASEPVFRLERGHVYVNASIVAAVMRELPSAFVSEGLLGILPESLREEVRCEGRATLSPAVLRTVIRLSLRERSWMPWTRAASCNAEMERVVADLAQLEPLPELGPREVAVRLAALRERLGAYLEVVSWAVLYAYVFFYLANELLRRWGNGASITDVVSGASGIRTFEVHRELERCADLARDDPAIREALLAGDPSVVAERCLEGDLGSFGAELRAILKRHGHRLTARDLAAPTWRERPRSLIEILRRLVTGSPAEVHRLASRLVRDHEREILRRAGVGALAPVQRELLRLCLRWCREYYGVRENMRYHADLFLAAMRELTLRAGSELERSGKLSSRGDVFYLTADELTALLEGRDGEATTESPSRLASRRHEEYARFPPVLPPECFIGRCPAPDGERADCAMAILRGEGVSPGRVTGAARVVRCLEDLESVRRGEVIVAPATDPSWASLLMLGCGLVLEMGGVLSHGAIVARELGIPAVVNVAGATSLVRTGDQLTIDGASGEISCSGRAPDPDGATAPG